MMTNPYERVRKIKEINTGSSSGDGYVPEAQKEVNQLLKDGWTLLAIHERSATYDDGGSFCGTIYILGREFTDTDPKEWQTE